MSAQERNTLLVHLNDMLVGRLRLLDGGFDATEFRFERSYLDRAGRPTLGQTFLDDPSPRRSRVRIPAFFSNLLPEGALRELLARRAGVHPSREFFLIRELGEDLPGAVVISTDGPIDAPPSPVEAELTAAPPTGETLRFSLAGLQLKFSAERHANRWRLPLHGRGGQWLLKMPDARHAHVPLNEWAMMTLARTVGITVPDVELVNLAEVGGLPAEVVVTEQQALLVRRFDRPLAAPRIHIEDFLQVLDRHPDGHDVKYRAGSYDQLARVIGALGGLTDLEEFVRRLSFNAMIGNGDAHLKNWSLWYPDGVNARLAPAYDLVSTIQHLDDPELALNLSGEKRYTALGVHSFRTLARQLKRVPGVAELNIEESAVEEWVVSTVDKVKAAWGEVVERARLPASFTERIQTHWRDLLLTSSPL